MYSSKQLLSNRDKLLLTYLNKTLHIERSLNNVEHVYTFEGKNHLQPITSRGTHIILRVASEIAYLALNN